MAQQGGTWLPSDIKQIKQLKKKGNNPESLEDEKVLTGPETSSSQDNKTDGQEWDIVKDSDAEPETQRGGFSNQFNFEVGWGKWKMTLLSWDIKVRRKAVQTKGRDPSSASITREKNSDTQPAERH
ncbi:hypothetical protein V8C43DRAFT_304223 [Trichoderma afarasin]